MLPLDARLDRLARSPRLRTVEFGHADGGEEPHPLRAAASGDPAMPHVYVTAGVHGDEPEVVLSCLNPSGLARGTRTNVLGQDINR